MPIVQTAAPAAEPLTLAEVSAHLRLDYTNYEPAPLAPAAALASPAAPGNVDNGAHRYLVTFVTSTGETEAGAISAAVTVANKTINGQVALTAIPLGGSSVTGRRIYRTIAGGSAFLFLAAITDNSTTAYTDNLADASLGASAPVTNTTGDPLLLMLIAAARQHAENICRRAFVTQSWQLTIDAFPMPAMNISSANWYGPQWGTSPGPLSVARIDGTTGFEIFLPLPKLQSVESIKYYDAALYAVADALAAVSTDPVAVAAAYAAALVTLPTYTYIVDTISEPARITPAPNQTWPAVANRINAVQVNFTCGYGAASAVPQGIKNWMLMRIGALYENREEIVVAQRVTVNELPFVDRLLDPFRVVKY